MQNGFSRIVAKGPSKWKFLTGIEWTSITCNLQTTYKYGARMATTDLSGARVHKMNKGWGLRHTSSSSDQKPDFKQEICIYKKIILEPKSRSTLVQKCTQVVEPNWSLGTDGMWGTSEMIDLLQPYPMLYLVLRHSVHQNSIINKIIINI